MDKPLIGIELKVVDRARVPDPAAAQRKADKENGRLQAQIFAAEALLTAVKVMRTSKDETQQLKAAKLIMERAWGIPKSAVEEEDNNRATSILDVLAAISSTLTSESGQPKLIHEAAPVAVQDKTQVLEDLDSLLVQDD